MKNLKFGILALGVLGLLGCFLPLVSERGLSMSLFKLRPFLGNAFVFLVIGGFAVAAAMGAMGLKRLLKWQAAVAAVGFGLVLLKMRSGMGPGAGMGKLLTDGAIGAKLVIVCAIAGVVVSILAAVKGTEE